MSDPPLVSILMPVHDGERFLSESVASVRTQSYERWELVIADNASGDATGMLARELAAEDARIRLEQFSEFVGVLRSYNRAFGLMSPEAKYCKPLAVDDLLLPGCLERMVALAERHPEVGIVSAYRRAGDDVDFHGFPAGVEVVAGPDVCRAALLGGVWVFGAASSVMIRADLVRARAPFYNEENLHADLESCYELLRESSFGFVHEVLTYTRRHSGSVTRRSAAALMTHRAENVRLLQRFGPVFLDDDQYARRLVVVLAQYAGELLSHARHLRSAEVRAYHRRVQGAILRSLTLRELLRGVVLQARRSATRRRDNGADWLAARYGGRASSEPDAR